MGPQGVLPIADCSAQAFGAQLAALSEAQEWFILGRNHAPDSPEISDEAFVEVAAGLMEALAPLYSFLCWGRDNDHVALRGELEERKAHSPGGGEGWAEGAQVRVTSGLFSGRAGVVQEVDKGGMVKVNVGNVVIQVKAEALEAAS